MEFMLCPARSCQQQLRGEAAHLCRQQRQCRASILSHAGSKSENSLRTTCGSSSVLIISHDVAFSYDIAMELVSQDKPIPSQTRCIVHMRHRISISTPRQPDRSCFRLMVN